MADEDAMYGGDDQDRFEAEEFDQDFMDGGVREDVSLSLSLHYAALCTGVTHLFVCLFVAGPS